MNKKDQEFLGGLFSPDQPQKNKFICVYKHGYVLSLLPLSRKHSLRALSLYQAQSFKARIYILYLKLALWFRAYFLLNVIELGGYREEFQFLEDSAHLGLLLGNPEAKSRRFVIYHCVDDVAYVTKLALGVSSSVSVDKEIRDLMQINESLRGATKVMGKSDEGVVDFSYYTVRWIKGRSPSKKHYLALVDLLGSWVDSEERTGLGELPVWKEVLSMTERLGEDDFVNHLTGYEVLTAPIHGDFSPWNIKITVGDEIHVLDWESYRSDGVAGWDLAHFLIQSKLLVDKMWPNEVIEAVLHWAKGDEGRNSLNELGWGDNYLPWIGSYLFYAQYKLGYDRTELIECWKEKIETSL